MIRKYYILALTFLCLLCGELSYGQQQWCNNCHSTGENILHFVGTPFRFIGSFVSYLNSPEFGRDYSDFFSNSIFTRSIFTDGDDPNSSDGWGSEGADDGWFEWTPVDYGGGSPEEYYDEFEDYYNFYFEEEGFYYSEEELNRYLSYYCSLYPEDCVNDNISWFLDKDGDGYYSETKNATVSPGVGWVKGTPKGLDCDDNEPTKTIDCNNNYYLDKDHDGYESATQRSLTSPGIGWEEGASMGIDCNDNDPVIRECIEPKPVEIINPANCRCIDPPKKPKFNNVTNIWNVLDGKKWIDYWVLKDCADSAKAQNKESTLLATPVGGGYQVNTFVDKKRQTESGKITPKIDLQKAVDVIAKNLKEGKPVMAGVMYERYDGADTFPGGTNGDNNNVATNHFITIVGMGIDNGKPYFQYYDNFVDPQYPDETYKSKATVELLGTNVSSNRLYCYLDSVGNYYFADKQATTIVGPQHGSSLQYVLTEVRDNQ